MDVMDIIGVALIGIGIGYFVFHAGVRQGRISERLAQLEEKYSQHEKPL